MPSKHVGFVSADTTAPPADRDAGGRRLALVGVLYAASLVLLGGMSLLADAAGHIESSRLVPAARPIAAAGIVAGVLVALVARRQRSRARREALAAGFAVTAALVLSLIEALKPWPDGGTVGVPMTSLWIVLAAMVLPLSLRASLATALSSAATGPLVAAALALAGRPASPSLLAHVYFFMPSFLAVVVAYVGSRALQHARGEVRRLGNYRLVAKIGEGGMGEVWRAEHHLLALPAAVKLVRVDRIPVAERATILKRFEREAQLTARLTSPHTVDLHDYGITDDGIVYYVMELIDGMDLERLVERHGPLPPARAVSFLCQACDSLAEAHAAGLMHRDIKPSNLLVCRAGLVHDYLKVLDFGLVRPVPHLASGHSLTDKGVVMGTPGFIAPEVALDRPGVDQRSDLYSLACIGYYLLSGEHVFDLSSPMRALHDHAFTAAPPLRTRAPSVPVELEAAIMRALSKDPRERPRDAETMATELAAAVTPWGQEEARRWWAERVPAQAARA